MSLSLTAILDPEFSARAREAWADDGIVDYAIHRRASAQERRFIDQAFARLDQALAVGFRRVEDRSQAEIRLKPLAEVPDGSAGFDITGETQLSYGTSADGAAEAQASIVWQRGRRAVIRGAKRQTVLHEIGHGLGLSHANGDPFDPAIDSAETIMSYNLRGFSGWYAPLDLLALQSIWG